MGFRRGDRRQRFAFPNPRSSVVNALLGDARLAEIEEETGARLRSTLAATEEAKRLGLEVSVETTGGIPVLVVEAPEGSGAARAFGEAVARESGNVVCARIFENGEASLAVSTYHPEQRCGYAGEAR